MAIISDAALILANQMHWEKAQITPARMNEVMNVVKHVMDGRSRYEGLSKMVGCKVPWWAIGVIHYRECDFSWHCNIAQGDPYYSVSRHVPKGMGPYKSWEDAGVAALTKAPPYVARWTNWTAGGALTILEKYNGVGYEAYHHMTSPYVYGATNMEQRGKYVRDGVFSASTWDTQIGTAAILLGMRQVDPKSVVFAEPK